MGTPIAAAVLDALRWAYPYRLAAITEPRGDTVVIVITGDLERCWYLRTTGSGWAFTDKPGTGVVARLRVTADQTWRLLMNNLSLCDQRGLDITGDEAVVNVLRRPRAIKILLRTALRLRWSVRTPAASTVGSDSIGRSGRKPADLCVRGHKLCRGGRVDLSEDLSAGAAGVTPRVTRTRVHRGHCGD
ncbi:MAG: hypothetical protein WCF33_13870 [Pseudonocardiaceae bacterium]